LKAEEEKRRKEQERLDREKEEARSKKLQEVSISLGVP
jgi:hypothetical protein